MKQINYDPKITSANTQYNVIDNADQQWILKECLRYNAMMSELTINKDENIKLFIREWYHKRNATLPKGRNGLNTPESFIAGIINNIMFGTQNDLSDIQMDALSNISAKMELFYKLVINLGLQSKEQPFMQIVFRQRLFQNL